MANTSIPQTEEPRNVPVQVEYSALPDGARYCYNGGWQEVEKVKGSEGQEEAQQASEQRLVYIWITEEEWERATAPHAPECLCTSCVFLPHVERARGMVAYWLRRVEGSKSPRGRAYAQQQLAFSRGTLRRWQAAYQADKARAVAAPVDVEREAALLFGEVA